MKVEPISNGNLRIWLSQEEYCRRDGDIRTILTRVLQAAGKSLARLGKQLVAELIPVEGGCVVLISTRRQPNEKVFLYRVDTLDKIYRLAEDWVTSLPIYTQTALYEYETGYIVAIYPQSHLSRRELALLRTYGAFCGRGMLAVAHVAEYGRLLAVGNALEQLIGREPHAPEPPDPVR